MKERFLMFSLLALLTAASVSAQEDNERRRERRNDMSIAEVYNRQAARLVKSMKLDDDKKDIFTALYLDYQNTRHNVVNPRGGDKEGEEQRLDLDNITDEQATEMIENNFLRQEKQLEVDKEYLPKFLEILTPAQAAHIFLRPGRRPDGRGPGGPGGPRGPRGRGGFGGPGGPGGFGGPGGGFGGPDF